MPLNHDDFIKSVKKGYSKQKTLLDKMLLSLRTALKLLFQNVWLRKLSEFPTRLLI